ncbi:alpha/beta hydrolase [Candidatus Poriferisocius sp.]|uniref:alpha/beta hydrolase n=1 Tax=Candidatus Poriferisocius sp. TaxID=3101276 RepID=UPI003B02A5B5
MLSEFPSADDMPTHDADPAEWKAWVEGIDSVMLEVFSSRIPEDVPISRSDFEIAGVRTHVLTPDSLADPASAPLYIDIHGGGLMNGGGDVCALMATRGALERDMITWAPDYRMPPDHLFPAALDDLMAVYRKALAEREPRDIFVAGGSAGGNLAPALLLRAKDEGLPMPVALLLFTPEVDLTESGDSFQTNLGIDKVLAPLMEINLLYAGGEDLSHPYLSPLFGDLAGFPPTYLQTGTRDLFLSNTVRMHRALRNAGVAAELHIGDAMPHGGFGGSTAEDKELADERDRFIARIRTRA